MTWIKALGLLIKYLPAVVEAIIAGKDFIELKIELKKFDAAAEKAKETKDTSDLDKILS